MLCDLVLVQLVLFINSRMFSEVLLIRKRTFRRIDLISLGEIRNFISRRKKKEERMTKKEKREIFLLFL